MIDETTPRPWGSRPCDQGGEVLLRGEAVSGGTERHPQAYIQIVPAADARLIVRAVNAHDAMVAALRLMMDPHTGHEYECVQAEFKEPGDDCSACCKTARAALALAEKGVGGE